MCISKQTASSCTKYLSVALRYVHLGSIAAVFFSRPSRYVFYFNHSSWLHNCCDSSSFTCVIRADTRLLCTHAGIHSCCSFYVDMLFGVFGFVCWYE